MSTRCSCTLKQLVGIICVLITAILLGLCIWRLMVWMQREAAISPPESFNFCKNGGTLEKNGCICPEQWKGWRCTIINFCNYSTYDDTTYGKFHFDKIVVGKYGPSKEKCESDTKNAGFPKATRLCTTDIYSNITLEDPSMVNCNQDLEMLATQIENSEANFTEISFKTLGLTSNADVLTSQNISYAATVVEQIFNTSKNTSTDAKKYAVTTVSQLLEANEDVFQKAGNFGNLTKELENYSLDLKNDSVFQPNIAIQSVDLSTENISESVTVLLSVQRGDNDILSSQRTTIDINEKELKPEDQTELQILINTTQKWRTNASNHHQKASTSNLVLFCIRRTNFFQSRTFTSRSNFSQRVVAGKVSDSDPNSTTREEVSDVSVEMIFKPKYDKLQFQLRSYACVFWNVTKSDWDTYGCKKKPSNNSQFLGCQCNHTTNFAVLMSFDNNYKYPDSLNIISNIGCGLSIAGLALTIIFQITTRKLRKTSITWVFVSLCTSMLIFNILFLFGIENSNKNSIRMKSPEKDDNVIPQFDIEFPENLTCTVMAALLHYFLLVTFTWTGLNAVQLYFLLLRTMRPLPEHFTIFLSLIGWGLPAIVVSLTVGIIYPLKGELGYRQEIICWLAVPKDNNYLESPWLWSFILPVSIILIANVVVFIFIIVKVLWGRTDNLTSTKKSSVMKKILSTLSIAVVFGLTWILGYLMLIDDNNVKAIFNYLFCFFNTTQGLQIFFLYTVKTKAFQNKASEVFKSMTSAARRIKMPSLKTISLHSQVYELISSVPSKIEHFRLLESSLTTQETFLSESSQNISHYKTIEV